MCRITDINVLTGQWKLIAKVEPDQLGGGMKIAFSQDLEDVRFNSPCADAKVFGNPGYGEPFPKQIQYLHFPVGKKKRGCASVQ